jgi:hypothetical protein
VLSLRWNHRPLAQAEPKCASLCCPAPNFFRGSSSVDTQTLRRCTEASSPLVCHQASATTSRTTTKPTRRLCSTPRRPRRPRGRPSLRHLRRQPRRGSRGAAVWTRPDSRTPPHRCVGLLSSLPHHASPLGSPEGAVSMLQVAIAKSIQDAEAGRSQEKAEVKAALKASMQVGTLAPLSCMCVDSLRRSLTAWRRCRTRCGRSRRAWTPRVRWRGPHASRRWLSGRMRRRGRRPVIRCGACPPR